MSCYFILVQKVNVTAIGLQTLSKNKNKEARAHNFSTLSLCYKLHEDGEKIRNYRNKQQEDWWMWSAVMSMSQLISGIFSACWKYFLSEMHFLNNVLLWPILFMIDILSMPLVQTSSICYVLAFLNFVFISETLGETLRGLLGSLLLNQWRFSLQNLKYQLFTTVKQTFLACCL